MKEGFTVFNCEKEEDSVCLLVINCEENNEVINLPWKSNNQTQDQEIGVWKIKNRKYE